jgi:hypothetical protein
MKSTYSGTLYVAGMGGHFSVADVSIDPNNQDAPITVNSLEMLDIGGKNYPTHDARIDASDKNIMYWSTYKLDNWKDDPESAKKGEVIGNLHVGKSNLKTGEVILDEAFPAPERAVWTGANYCASGQSATSYMPISMANEGYIDVYDKNTMYWSTYKLDTWKDKDAKGGNLHVGKSDLKTGEVLADVAFPAPERAVWTGANYCASGQSATSFMPISMANEGYIDVYDKATMKLNHRIFLDDLGIKAGETTFAHGTNTPDMKKFLLTVNDTPEGFTKWTGNTKLIYLDMAALEQGKLVKLQEAVITGKPKDAEGGTITFRQYFSQDGKYIFQSGADRAYLIDAATLTVLDEITPLPGEAHDMMPTPDGKYAVITLREKAKDFEGNDSVDGTILLYDVEARATVGSTSSVCFSCHKGEGIGKASLWGLDANWK